MFRNLKLGKIGGIGVYVHWTFWLLVLFYLITSTLRDGLAAGLLAVVFIFGIFACVLLHEFGHAAAAAYYGIKTADITLLPFGGMARLTRLPELPMQELVIALAGPAVNVFLALILSIGVLLGISVPISAPAFQGGMAFLEQLLIVNVILCVFNLLPAFPMDGGRVLRSLLAMRTGQLRATEIAASVGRWMALAFTIYAFASGSFQILLVAGFVYVAGTAELMQIRARAAYGSTSFGHQTFDSAIYDSVQPTSRQSSTAAGGSAYSSETIKAERAENWKPRASSENSQTRGDDTIEAVSVRRL